VWLSRPPLQPMLRAMLATQRPPLDLDKMCVLIEVALHFGAKQPNLGMRSIVRNVIIVA
jgi:hypothetical protein